MSVHGEGYGWLDQSVQILDPDDVHDYGLDHIARRDALLSVRHAPRDPAAAEMDPALETPSGSPPKELDT
ncbi:hypothetical protein GCM10027184_78310 [Saccharothrix stipae]